MGAGSASHGGAGRFPWTVNREPGVSSFVFRTA